MKMKTAGALVALVFFVPQAHAICSLCGTVCPETCFEQLAQMVNDDQMVYNADGNISIRLAPCPLRRSPAFVLK